MTENQESPWDELESWINQPSEKPITQFYYHGILYTEANFHELPDEFKEILKETVET